MTNTAQHTPGPWHWKIARSLRHLHDSRNNCFAQVSMPAPIKNVHDYNFHQYEFYEAIAALIAAAPEVLEALKSARKYLNDAGFARPVLECDAAIAKAEGK